MKLASTYWNRWIDWLIANLPIPRKRAHAYAPSHRVKKASARFESLESREVFDASYGELDWGSNGRTRHFESEYPIAALTSLWGSNGERSATEGHGTDSLYRDSMPSKSFSIHSGSSEDSRGGHPTKIAFGDRSTKAWVHLELDRIPNFSTASIRGGSESDTYHRRQRDELLGEGEASKLEPEISTSLRITVVLSPVFIESNIPSFDNRGRDGDSTNPSPPHGGAIGWNSPSDSAGIVADRAGINMEERSSPSPSLTMRPTSGIMSSNPQSNSGSILLPPLTSFNPVQDSLARTPTHLLASNEELQTWNAKYSADAAVRAMLSNPENEGRNVLSDMVALDLDADHSSSRRSDAIPGWTSMPWKSLQPATSPSQQHRALPSASVDLKGSGDTLSTMTVAQPSQWFHFENGMPVPNGMIALQLDEYLEKSAVPQVASMGSGTFGMLQWFADAGLDRSLERAVLSPVPVEVATYWMQTNMEEIAVILVVGSWVASSYRTRSASARNKSWVHPVELRNNLDPMV